MILCIDVGNSETVLGLFEGEELRCRARLATQAGGSPDHWARTVEDFLRGGLATDHCPLTTAPVVSSVVPAANEPLARALARAGLLPPLFITAQMAGLRTEYRDPERIGADRVANAVAAIDLYGCPAIVVDLGTATTVDAISEDGVFLGGAIAPGVEISARALTASAALLPEVPLRGGAQVPALQAVIGRETVEAMQSGILYGAAAMIDGLVERVAEEMYTLHAPRPSLHVIATGGLASLIAPLCRRVSQIDPLLTLHGLRIIGERGRGQKTAD